MAELPARFAGFRPRAGGLQALWEELWVSWGAAGPGGEAGLGAVLSAVVNVWVREAVWCHRILGARREVGLGR